MFESTIIMPPQKIPTTGTRSHLTPSISTFLKDHPDLHLGGIDDFHQERAHHLKVFGITNIPSNLHHPIASITHTAIPGPYSTIPIRILSPSTPSSTALIYFHGGGYTVGSVDEFENGLRLLAESSSTHVFAVEYRLAPEHRYPTQLDEYDAVIEALHSSFGQPYGIRTVLGGGDSAGGNMTAAISLRRKDEGKKNLDGQVLFYPEARVPFDTPAAVENNSGYYLECNGIFAFADHYLPRGVPPSTRYVSPGMQEAGKLGGLPPALVYTSGWDPLRDVGVEYASKLQAAGNDVTWRHHGGMTHGWLQMTAWSKEAAEAVKEVGGDIRKITGQAA